MPISTLAMLKALPLSRDSMAASCSTFCSKRSANLTRCFPRCSGVTSRHVSSNAFRAADTAISTSFSVASWTAVMGFSVAGLIDSKVLPSTPLTNSLLMNLMRHSQHDDFLLAGQRRMMRGIGGVYDSEHPRRSRRCKGRLSKETYSPVGCSYFPVWGVSIVAVTDIVRVDVL